MASLIKATLFEIKDAKILLFLVEYYAVNVDIIRYYLLLNFTALKHHSQNMDML